MICLFKAHLYLPGPQQKRHSHVKHQRETASFPIFCVYTNSMNVCRCLYILNLNARALSFWLLYAMMFSWWCVFATTDFKSVYLSHRFHFAPFLLFIVQLFKLFVVIRKYSVIHQFCFSHSLLTVVNRQLKIGIETIGERVAWHLPQIIRIQFENLKVWLNCKHLRKHCVL